MRILNLTRQEKQVVIFLLSAALLGLGVKFYLKSFPSIQTGRFFNREPAKINLNSADKAVLTGLPGIGEKIAGRIIDYREKNRGFKSADELKQVKGIGNSGYEKISGLICTE